MRELANKSLMNEYIKRFKILSLFDSEQLPFHLYQFEKGEILNNIMATSKYLQFVVEGTLYIYANHRDGSSYPLCQVNCFTVLGDVEFCNADISPFLVEAKTTVLCIALHLWECKDVLLQDNCLLRFLLQSVSEKLRLFSKSQVEFSNLEEKLLHYMQTECPERMITNVGETAFQMRCSRRQLQRVLKKLTEQRLIRKCGKGHYQMVQENSFPLAQK